MLTLVSATERWRRGAGRRRGDLQRVYQPALTLSATISWILLFMKSRFTDAQLLPLAADQASNTKDITCQQLPRCPITR